MARAIILVDEHGQIAYRNEPARQFLDRADPVYLQDGTLACSDARESQMLSILLAKAVSFDGLAGRPGPAMTSSFRLTCQDGRRIAATVVALLPHGGPAHRQRPPQALLTIVDPMLPVDVETAPLVSAFGLSRAEARVTRMLVKGNSPEECAKALDIKISTVRTQLVSAYRKTGASGQADLVRIVLSGLST
jgi:DNA-binding CsgD family transcriptional regulator